MAGAGETAEKQYTLLVVSRGHVFFRNQVHPIVQGSDHAQIRVAIIRKNLFPAVMTWQQNNRPPLAGLEPAIDALSLLLHFQHEIVVAPNFRPAWGANLHEGEFAA